MQKSKRATKDEAGETDRCQIANDHIKEFKLQPGVDSQSLKDIKELTQVTF